jgi:hypothetical protein
LHLADTPPDAPGVIVCGKLAIPHKMWYYSTYVCQKSQHKVTRRTM